MNPFAWLQGLEGLTLALVICAFLFIEEAGVPVPFAPGDLLLATGGIAIAAGRVHPVEMIALATASIVAGAVLGRELFALLGWERLMKVAGPLHARVPLERASAMLHRNGWRAVFTARLIPGLRVHTTQVAGVSHMPRHSFLGGLIPATLVYVAAFVGLGTAFGRPVLELIHRAEHQALLVGGVLVAGIVAVLWLRRPAQRTLASLGGWAGVFKFRLDSPGIILIPACIGLNFTGHTFAVGFGLPLFLDSIGTVLCGVIAGPWVGGSVGLITNLVSSNTVDPIAAPYSVVSFLVGFAAGVGRYLGWHERPSGWLALWATCFLIASVASTPLNLLVNEGRSAVPLGDAVYANLAGTRLPRVLAAYGGEAVIDLPDKLITVLAALLIQQSLPRQPVQPRSVELDIGRAFVSIVRYPRWRRKLAAGAACVLFSWLLVPFLLLAGYSVAVARAARDGSAELPAWDQPGRKLKEGTLISLAVLIWYVPAALLALPADLAGVNGLSLAGLLTAPANVALGLLAALGGLWGLLVLLLQPVIWAQFLQGGFGAAFHVPRILRRIGFNAGLLVVAGAVNMVLAVIAMGGFLAFGVGILLTFPYASWVAARLVGEYARLTDMPSAKAPRARLRHQLGAP